MVSFKSLAQASLLALFTTAQAVTIAEINGNKYISPYSGKTLTNITGLVTAVGPNGFWLRSTTPDNDDRTSESVYVYNRAAAALRTVGEIVTLDGRVTEYRSNKQYVYLLEIDQPKNVRVNGSATPVPVVLGTTTNGIIGKKDLFPPTEQYTSLDNGNIFGVPNNQSQLSVANPTLQPSKYGMDFWQSLLGELVTISKPTAASRPNNYQETWVYGNWSVSGLNGRGGLTVVGTDANPEALIVGEPLDGTENPTDTRLGDSLEDITGVIYQQFGFYYILPRTALKTVSSRLPDLAPATSLNNNALCLGFTAGDYNIENFSPASGSAAAVANHIVNWLKSPTIMFLQEVQDNNGPVNDDVVAADQSITALTDQITAQGGVSYKYATIDPVDDTNGGQPGGNIRNVYLYDPRYMRLRSPNPGNSTTAVQLVPAPFFGIGGPSLSVNPGLIDPNNAAFVNSRKPLIAQWETWDGINRFFTINLHLQSKGGSSSLEGDLRPPVNGGVEDRNDQLTIVAVSPLLLPQPSPPS